VVKKYQKIEIYSLQFCLLLFINNKMNNNTITITREHDKLCILQKWLNNNLTLESHVSNYIDSCSQNNQYKIMKYLRQIKEHVSDITHLYNIIKLSRSIAFQTPYQITLDETKDISKLIKYLEQPYIQFIPNASYLLEFS
jgi:hypothetical protein